MTTRPRGAGEVLSVQQGGPRKHQRGQAHALGNLSLPTQTCLPRTEPPQVRMGGARVRPGTSRRPGYGVVAKCTAAPVADAEVYTARHRAAACPRGAGEVLSVQQGGPRKHQRGQAHALGNLSLPTQTCLPRTEPPQVRMGGARVRPGTSRRPGYGVVAKCTQSLVADAEVYTARYRAAACPRGAGEVLSVQQGGAPNLPLINPDPHIRTPQLCVLQGYRIGSLAFSSETPDSAWWSRVFHGNLAVICTMPNFSYWHRDSRYQALAT